MDPEQLRSLFDCIPLGVYGTTPEGRGLSANKALADLLGYASVDELIEAVDRASVADVVYAHPRERAAVVALTQGGGGQWRVAETRFRRRDGAVVDVRVTSSISGDEETGGRRLYAFVEDISARMQAEDPLGLREETFRTVADFTRDWEYWRSPRGDFIYVSPSCEEISGYRADEFLNDPDLLLRIIHPDDRAQFEDHIERPRLDGQVSEEIRFRIVTRSGQVRWIDHVCRCVYGQDGEWKGVRAGNRDVTDHKRVEDALRAVTSEMERQRALLEALLDMVSSPALQTDRDLSRGEVAQRVLHDTRCVVGSRNLAFFLTDDAGRIVETSRVPRSTRRPPPETIGMVQWVAINRAALGLSRDWLRTREAGRRLVSADAADVGFAVLAPGEMYIPVLTASRCHGVLWVDGPEEGPAYSPRTSGLLVAVANLLAAFLERRALQEAAERAGDRRQADETRAALLSSVSHQLKTPLAGLTATITNLLEGDLSWEEADVRTELTAALADISRLSNSIGALLDLSRLEAHAWTPRPDWHDVEDLVETAMFVLPPADRARVDSLIGAAAPAVYVDFEQVVRVLQHLLENAAVYAGPDAAVRIGARITPGTLRVWVEDDGPGIPEHERERVFEKFYRTPQGAKVPSGTGLGLALAREIVQTQGGTIDVEENVPHGARFVVELPQPLGDAEAGSGRRDEV